MKVNRFIVLSLILSIHLAIIVCQPLVFQKIILQEQIKQSPCEIVQLDSQTYLGATIFKNDNNPSNCCSPHMVLSGWFLVRPYIANQQYTLFIFKDNLHNISIELQYNSQKQKFYLFLINRIYIQQSSVPFEGTWIFIYADFYFKDGNLKTIYNIYQRQNLMVKMVNTDSIAYILPFNSFSKINMKIEIGNVFGSLPYVACALTKKIVFYWFEDTDYFNTDVLTNFFADISSGSTYLYQYFDFFYPKYNPGKLTSIGYNQNPLLLSHQRADAQEIKSDEIIATDFINIDEEFGIILSFQAKLSNPNTNIVNTFFTINNPDNPLEIFFVGNDTVRINAQDIVGVDLTIWNQFTLIIKHQFTPRAILLVGINTTPKSQQIDLPSQYFLEQLQFGKIGNTQSVFVSNIRIYKGNYLTTKLNCQVAAKQFDSDCMICDQNLILQYSTSPFCVSNNGQVNEIDGVLNLNTEKAICNFSMIYDPSNVNSCLCLKGFYKDIDNQCQKCPSYCLECSSLTLCTIFDPNRTPNGSCLASSFDDGYTCIDPSSMIRIISRENIIQPEYFSNDSIYSVLAQPTINCGNDGNWYHQYYTFQNPTAATFTSHFISFGFSFDADSNLDSTLFKYDGGSSYTIRITIQYLLGDYCVSVYDCCSLQQTFNIYEDEEIWVGIFISLSYYTVIVNQHGTFQAQMFVVNAIAATTIEIGPNPDTGDPTCVSLSQTKPYQQIFNIQIPLDSNTLNTLFWSDKKQLARFIVDKEYQFYNQESANYLIEEQLNIKFLKFPNSLDSFSTTSGFTFQNGRYGEIDEFTNESKCALSFFFVILISEIHMQTPLISYKIKDGFEVKISLFPLFSSSTVAFRVCFGQECQDGHYSFLSLNEVGFVTISSKQVSPFSADFYFQEFEIVCNYKRETLQFVGTQYNFGNKIQNFTVGYSQQPLNPYNYTLTNFNIFEGDGFFYYDYSADTCFAFVNLSNMNCLYLKKQYVYCDGQITLESDCLATIDSSQYHYYHNIYNQTYTFTNIFKPICDTILLDEITDEYICSERDSILFQCLSGFYDDVVAQKCFACSEDCKQCQGSSTNCTTCQYPEGKSLPSCQCSLSHQFIDKTQGYSCQSCATNCSECFEEESKCTECAENRIDPPLCKCNTENYTEIQGECVLLTCDYKCETCSDSSSNCIKCSAYRQSPPECACFDDFEEIDDGSCQSCKQNQYYDSQSKKCISCSTGCNQCAGKQCLECQSPLELKENSCVCGNQNQSQVVKIDNQNQVSVLCLNNMSITIQSYQYKSYIDITILFSNELQPIEQNGLSNLFTISFTVIPSTSYSLSNPRIINNKLIITLELFVSISKIQGYILFNGSEKFMSKTESEVLSSTYSIYPTQFEIGPFFKLKDNMSQNLDESTQGLLESQVMNSSMMNIMNSMLFFYYILNTLQPSSYFLLLKAIYPPHLYKFYQVIGKLIFPFVPDYQSSQIKEEFSLFGYTFGQNDISLVEMQPFKQLGYSTCILVNIPIILLKYLIFSVIYGIIQSIVYFKITDSTNPKIILILSLIKDRLDSENEVNLLSVSLVILLQLFQTEQSQWISRVGFYITLIVTCYLIFYFHQNFINIKTNKFMEINDCYFTQRVDLANSSYFSKYYFLAQFLKKYLAIIILFSFYEYPIIGCSLISFLFAMSCFSTILMKPYKNTLSRILKVLGEFLSSIIWILQAILVSLEKNLFKNYLIDEDESKEYINLGSVIMILLFSYNLIYLIEFIYNIIQKIYQIISEKLKNKEATHLQLASFKSMRIKDLKQENEILSPKRKLIK